MAKRLIWTPEPRWWLREIHEYISRDSHEAAHKVVRGIFDKAHRAAHHPVVLKERATSANKGIADEVRAWYTVGAALAGISVLGRLQAFRWTT